MKRGISGNYRNSYDTPPVASTVPVPENPRAFKEMCPCPLPEIRGFFAASPNFPQRHYVIPVTNIPPKLFYGGPLPRSVPVIRGGEGDSPGIEGPNVNSNISLFRCPYVSNTYLTFWLHLFERKSIAMSTSLSTSYALLPFQRGYQVPAQRVFLV